MLRETLNYLCGGYIISLIFLLLVFSGGIQAQIKAPIPEPIRVMPIPLGTPAPDVPSATLIPQDQLSVVSVDSEEDQGEDGFAKNVLDGNPDTIWHTQWSNRSPQHPHELVLDLGANYAVSEFRYLPRQLGSVNGTITEYKLYVSADDTNWGTPVADGTWPGDRTEKAVQFTATMGQYVRFVALAEVHDKPWSSAAELNVVGVPIDPNLSGFSGRVAVTADGNGGDRDDIGATALTLFMLARAGMQYKLVHYDFNSNLYKNNAEDENAMTISALDGADKFGYSRSIFFNAYRDPDNVVRHLKDKINESSSGNKLTVLLAGPMDVFKRAIELSDSSKIKYVTLINHSMWNCCNSDNGSAKAYVISLGVNWVDIPDQNGGHRAIEGFKTEDMDSWNFLHKYTHGSWLYHRIDSVDNTDRWGETGDASDAGMMYYLLTGDEKGNVVKLENWIDNLAGTPVTPPGPLPSDVSSVTLIPQDQLNVVSIDSQETRSADGSAKNAIDGNPDTIWHIRWAKGSPPSPPEIVLDLGDHYDVSGFQYLPPQRGPRNGTITEYELYVSSDGTTWGTPVAAGTWPGDAMEKVVHFTGTPGRYVRLVALAELNGNPWASAAELNVLFKREQDVGVVGRSWQQRSPSAVGMISQKLDDFRDATRAQDGCVIRNGYLVYQWGDIAKRQGWASAYKPVNSTMLLFALNEGKINSMDDPVRAYVQKIYGRDLIEKDKSMTFRHLANMTSGYTLPEAPGEAYGYNDLGIALTQTLLYGYDQWGREPNSVFGVGSHRATLHGDRLGALGFEDNPNFGGGSGEMSVRDFARIGWFWANKGNWRGRQLLPQEYFGEYMKSQVPEGLPRTNAKAGEGDDYLDVPFGELRNNQTPLGQGSYGFNWWFNTPVRILPHVPEDMIHANGNWNKRGLVVFPSLGVVAVWNEGPWDANGESPHFITDLNNMLRKLAESVVSPGTNRRRTIVNRDAKSGLRRRRATNHPPW